MFKYINKSVMEKKNEIEIILDAIFPFVFAGFPDDKLDEYLKEELSEEQFNVYLKNKKKYIKFLK